MAKNCCGTPLKDESFNTIIARQAATYYDFKLTELMSYCTAEESIIFLYAAALKNSKSYARHDPCISSLFDASIILMTMFLWAFATGAAMTR
jgi:hypothetical protein